MPDLPEDNTEDEQITDRTVLGDRPTRPREMHASMVVIHGERLGERVRLGDDPLQIGRGAESGLQLNEPSVSRKHCEITHDGERYRIRDLGATNRTYLNDQPIIEAWLADGDHVTVGQTILKFVGPTNLEARYHAEVHQRTIKDPLTGLHNRRYFLDMLEREIARFDRHSRAFSVTILDIDLFKPINDALGHIGGDDILRDLGRLLRERVRRNDIAARIGGEEFALLLPETPLEQAAELAEHLRRAVAEHPFRGEDKPVAMTISAGVAEWIGTMHSASDILRAADRALYEAKDAGRNRVRLSKPG